MSRFHSLLSTLVHVYLYHKRESEQSLGKVLASFNAIQDSANVLNKKKQHIIANSSYGPNSSANSSLNYFEYRNEGEYLAHLNSEESKKRQALHSASNDVAQEQEKYLQAYIRYSSFNYLLKQKQLAHRKKQLKKLQRHYDEISLYRYTNQPHSLEYRHG